MKRPVPLNEEARLQEIFQLNLSSLLPKGELDDFSQIAAKICNTPVALVSIVGKDEQSFLSKCGIEVESTPRDISFCQFTIMSNESFIVEDASIHPQFKENPLVTGETHVRFYAGFPLTTSNGFNIGSLCVIDTQPGTINSSQSALMYALAHQIVKTIELRKDLQVSQNRLKGEQWLNSFNTHLVMSGAAPEPSPNDFLTLSLEAFAADAALLIPQNPMMNCVSVNAPGGDLVNSYEQTDLKKLLFEKSPKGLHTESDLISWKTELEDALDCPLGSFTLKEIRINNAVQGWVLLAYEGYRSNKPTMYEERALDLLAVSLCERRFEPTAQVLPLKIPA